MFMPRRARTIVQWPCAGERVARSFKRDPLRWQTPRSLPMTRDEVVAAAQKAHRAHWRMTGDESEGDKRADAVTKAWQDAVCRKEPRTLVAEFRVAKHLRERIDLVDTKRGIAYEMKVSPNNAHFEFYRDVFKAIVARDHGFQRLSRLVFMAPAIAAQRLRASLAGEVQRDATRFGLRVEIRDL